MIGDIIFGVIVGGMALGGFIAMICFGLKEFTYTFEKIEEKIIKKKNKDIVAFFPNNEWRKFLNKNKLNKNRRKFSYINIKINQLLKNNLIEKNDLKRLNKELQVIIELMLKSKNGKREANEIYKAVREFENRIDSSEFLKEHNLKVAEELDKIERELPMLVDGGRNIEKEEINSLIKELLKLDPRRKDAKIFKIAEKIIEIDGKSTYHPPNYERIRTIKRTVLVLLKGKIEELTNQKEREDIERVKEIKEKIKESQK